MRFRVRLRDLLQVVAEPELVRYGNLEKMQVLKWCVTVIPNAHSQRRNESARWTPQWEVVLIEC